MGGVKCGTILEGAAGKYKITQKVGEGGNGNVYSVIVIEQKEELPYINFVVKVLRKDSQQKRKKRFYKEISVVLLLQKTIKGIIPILDHSKENDENHWYLMPKAKSYQFVQRDTLTILEDFIGIGRILNDIHLLGYAHRDIKPDNIMLLENKVCLTDFGMVWKEDVNDNITDHNDHIGPLKIRPPELETINLNARIDYRASDVYLLAKTLWMVLMHNMRGFAGEYNRGDNQIYINPERLNTDMTLEPLHTLMEQSTKMNYNDRIQIREAIVCISNQIKVFKHKAAECEISRWKFDESIKYSIARAEKTAIVIDDWDEIIKFLERIKGVTSLKLLLFGTVADLGIFKGFSILEKDNLMIGTLLGEKEYTIRFNIAKIEYKTNNKCYLFCGNIHNNE